MESKNIENNDIISNKNGVIKSEFYATGRRKTSVARVWLRKGKGEFTVNRKTIKQYFVRGFYVNKIFSLFKLLKVENAYNLYCTVKGGGTTGQADSVFHGISRALSTVSEDFHKILSSNKFLTRDSRIVERKKYGKHKARKSTQFSKR